MVIDIQGIKVSYGSTLVLRDITFSVGKGEMLGIIGPNGSGKSTLIKAMTHLLKPDEGSVSFNGMSLGSMSRTELAKQVAVVEQDIQSDFDFTVREIVSMGRTPHQRFLAGENENDKKAIEKAIRLTRIDGLSLRSFKALSGGERQRVVIARALAQETGILLLDEPTSHLDIGNQVEILDMVKKLTSECGTTVVAVLHDLNLAAQYCDSLLLMQNGRVEAAGIPSSVITEANIERVYGVRAAVKVNPSTNRPYVLLQPSVQEEGRKGRKVHVICGGGSGAEVLRILAAQGCLVSAGVLNLVDSDAESCQELGIPFAWEEPFHPITDAAHRKNLEFIDGSDVVVLTCIPFGPGNLLNLKAASKAVSKGKQVILLGSRGICPRDFTGGEASRLLEEIEGGGALKADSPQSLIRLIEQNSAECVV
jgi:iron complex transport system ATP-binding protein